MREPQTFESFLATRSTAAAVGACRTLVAELIESPGVRVLHGPPGTGKTHLVRATAAEARRRAYRVEEATAFELYARIVESVRGRRDIGPWTGAAHVAELLVVDDLQALAARPVALDALARLILQTVARRTSVLVASGVAPDSLLALTRPLATEDSYLALYLRPLPPRELQRVVNAIAARQGMRLSPETAGLIAERSRGDVGLARGLIVQLEAAVRWRTRDAAAATVARLERGAT